MVVNQHAAACHSRTAQLHVMRIGIAQGKAIDDSMFHIHHRNDVCRVVLIAALAAYTGYVGGDTAFVGTGVTSFRSST